jgi:hypothetical protein
MLTCGVILLQSMGLALITPIEALLLFGTLKSPEACSPNLLGGVHDSERRLARSIFRSVIGSLRALYV